MDMDSVSVYVVIVVAMHDPPSPPPPIEQWKSLITPPDLQSRGSRVPDVHCICECDSWPSFLFF